MTVTPLHAAVIGWLRYEQRCPIVMLERSPWRSSYRYRPDVIGVNRKWQVIEVEFKSSLADFHMNSQKREIQMRERGHSFCMPWKFYWAVPTDLVFGVRNLIAGLPDGLLTLGTPTRWGPTVECVRGARINENAVPIHKREAIRLVMHQSGTLHRLALAAAGCAVTLP